MTDFIQLLKLPQRTIVNNKITKKVIVESNQLSASEKRLVKDDIAEIIWLAVIKPDTYNVQSYITNDLIFDEVHFINVKINTPTKLNKIADLFHKIIPYHVVLFIEHNNNIAVSCANKRINLNDTEKRIIENIITTTWFSYVEDSKIIIPFFNSVAIPNIVCSTLNNLYSSIVNSVNNLIVSTVTGAFINKDKERTLLDIQSIEQIEKLEMELTKLRKSVKKETQFSKQYELSQKIAKCKEEIERIKSRFIANS